MFGLPLTFAAPLALIAFAALPILWLLLRLTPPQPRRIDFPPLKIVADLQPLSETPVRTPWWLLLLRLLLAAFLIAAAAGPIWNAKPPAPKTGPLLLLLDNGATSAHEWTRQTTIAQAQIEEAERSGRTVALLALGDIPQDITALAPAAALERLRSLAPVPYLIDRSVHESALRKFLASPGPMEIVWISDGIAGPNGQNFAKTFADIVGAHGLTIHKQDRSSALALNRVENAITGMSVRIVRAEPNGRETGTLRALDAKGAVIAEAPFAFGKNESSDGLTAEAQFSLPLELRNAIVRFEIGEERSAAGVFLVDGRNKRQRIGIVGGDTLDQAQPLLSPTYYIEKALSPYTETRIAKGATADAVRQLLDAKVSVLVLSDIGALDDATRTKIVDFVEAGGMLVRFSGPRVAAGNDDLVPVRLRRGGRTLGGVLSWDAPKTLAPFGTSSPFQGLSAPADLAVSRQILAEPDGDLPAKTWAALTDGTPIVTAARRGKGRIVLFHVTADTRWSNLPLSGLFVDMLKQITSMADAPPDDGQQNNDAAILPPRLVLDGFGAFETPPPWASGVAKSYTDPAVRQHPAGFYGAPGTNLAVNVLGSDTLLQPLDFSPLKAEIVTETLTAGTDLRASLLTAALLLFVIDLFLSFYLGGHGRALNGRLVTLGVRQRRTALWHGVAIILSAAVLAGSSERGDAQNPPRQEPANPPRGSALPPSIASGSFNPALITRLAYVKTGNAQLDAASRAGLIGLTRQLSLRTSFDAAEPDGVDPVKDELAFYPLLYWPIDPAAPQPSEAALRKIDAFMKSGGTVVFDTRDALNDNGSGLTPETQYLKRLLASIDIPGVEPVPADHVLTKTFYLLQGFPGRYATGRTWVESLPPKAEEDEEKGPVRGGDGVSPIIITSNDLAAAWAVGDDGRPLYPVVGGERRQREFAYRAGINIVMYVLTGNYKSDQVHVPALLERLGQ